MVVVLPKGGKLRDRFDALVAQWKLERDPLTSDPAQWAMCLAYQKVIGLGPAAIPLILAELQREPDHWFWALHVLTDENPIKPEHSGEFSEMVQDWIDWGDQRGFLPSQASHPVSKQPATDLKSAMIAALRWGTRRL